MRFLIVKKPRVENTQQSKHGPAFRNEMYAAACMPG